MAVKGQGRALGVAAAALGAVLMACTAAADVSMRQLDADRVMITDFKGKPPFKRRIVAIDDLSPTEFARFEAITAEPVIDTARIGQRVQVVDFRGKPPFKRQTVEIDASNASTFARFEETPAVEKRPAQRRSVRQFPVRR